MVSSENGVTSGLLKTRLRRITATAKTGDVRDQNSPHCRIRRQKMATTQRKSLSAQDITRRASHSRSRTSRGITCPVPFPEKKNLGSPVLYPKKSCPAPSVRTMFRLQRQNPPGQHVPGPQLRLALFGVQCKHSKDKSLYSSTRFLGNEAPRASLAVSLAVLSCFLVARFKVGYLRKRKKVLCSKLIRIFIKLALVLSLPPFSFFWFPSNYMLWSNIMPPSLYGSYPVISHMESRPRSSRCLEIPRQAHLALEEGDDSG